MGKAMDPHGMFIKNIFIDKKAARRVGDTALRSLGFSEREGSALQGFISEVLGPQDPLIELWQPSRSATHPYGDLALVLKLSACRQRTWRIIFIDLPPSMTEAIGRALDALVPALTTWPRGSHRPGR
jgi:hypothetical protein